MIIVANTTELEKKYDLNKLQDDEQVIVRGGLGEKRKYSREKYGIRTTYTVRQIKQIIVQMKLIESSIPKEWDKLQRAKYIYEVLGKRIEYNHNKNEYKTQQSSNLSIILSRKGICAGYSLLYKEMMDRQGIECDYIRGNISGLGIDELHAWNVLTINGQSFPVDLTWDANRMRNGENGLRYFGVDQRFHERHIPDADERKYNYTVFPKEYIDAINTDTTKRQSEISEEQKNEIIKLAIEETYKKFQAKVRK